MWGRVFGDRYKAVVVEGTSRFYYETLVDYIHLNPVRAGLIKPQAGQGVRDYAWSSVAGGYALPANRRAKWLAAETGLEVFGFADEASGRRKYVERLDRRAVEDGAKKAGVVEMPAGMDRRRSHLREGWYWGSQEFAERLLKVGEKTLRKQRERGYGASQERKAHDLGRAERLLAEGMRAAGLSTEELKKLPGSEPRKVAVARTIWKSTTVGQGWLAEQLWMGSAANVSQQMRREAVGPPRSPLPKALRQWMDLVKI